MKFLQVLKLMRHMLFLNINEDVLVIPSIDMWRTCFYICLSYSYVFLS